MSHDDIESALVVLPVLIEKAGTGGSLFRQLWADFAHETAEVMGDRRCLSVAWAYQECAHLWSALAASARARAGAQQPVADRLESLSGYLLLLANIEYEAAGLMREIASGR
jgi:hypothetical protein